jgi:hypothetical protein
LETKRRGAETCLLASNCQGARSSPVRQANV